MRKTLLSLLLAASAGTLMAQPNDGRLVDSSDDKNIMAAALKGWSISLGASAEIGGISPIPLPRSIRKLNSFNPLLNLSVEGAAHKRFTPHWGLSLGLRFETKGMKTDATVKNYHMRITETTQITATDGSTSTKEQTMEGGWTGPVVTKARNTYLTIPVLATYTFSNDRWTLNAGPYFSILLSGEFEGNVYDGYIRTSGNQDGKEYIADELGENVSVTYATYDFADDMRRFAWGLQVGASFRAYKHLYVNANLDWGLNSIFPKDFKTITFKMYPIYGTLGFSYQF